MDKIGKRNNKIISLSMFISSTLTHSLSLSLSLSIINLLTHLSIHDIFSTYKYILYIIYIIRNCIKYRISEKMEETEKQSNNYNKNNIKKKTTIQALHLKHTIIIQTNIQLNTVIAN